MHSKSFPRKPVMGNMLSQAKKSDCLAKFPLGLHALSTGQKGIPACMFNIHTEGKPSAGIKTIASLTSRQITISSFKY